MALNTLTLAITKGVLGRPFEATILGLTAGTEVSLDQDASPGFSTVNGRIFSRELDLPVSTVAIRERNPNTGETAVTRIDIAAASLPFFNILKPDVPAVITDAGSAPIQGKTSGTTLTLATNPDGAWSISGGSTLNWTTAAIGRAGRPVIVESTTISTDIQAETLLASAMLQAAEPLPSIGGVTIGTNGTGSLAGYRLAGGQDFGSALADMLVRPGNPYGTMANNFSQRDRRLTSTTSVGCLADAYSTGWNDANDGVAISSYADILAVAGSKLTVKSRKATLPERALQGVRTNSSGPAYTYRPMTWADLTFLADFAYSGERILEFRWRANIPAGVRRNVSGANAGIAFWELVANGGSEAQANGENDLYEYHLSATGGATIFGSASPGGAYGTLEDGSWQLTRVTFLTATIVVEAFSDSGTLLGSRSFNNSAGQTAKIWYFLAGVLNVTISQANSAPFNESLWDNQEVTMDMDYVRVWTPLASTQLVPLVANADALSMDVGATATLVLPSQATLWGGAASTELIKFAHAYDTNGPGRASEYSSSLDFADTLPVGVTYNSGTRTLSFASTFSTQPGVIHGYVYGKNADTGFMRPYKFVVYVKPKIAVPALPTPVPGSPYSYTIPRGSPRNWDCGNCPNGAHSGLTLVPNAAYSWLSFDPITLILSGNCPGDYNTSTQWTFACTNGAGISSQQAVLPGAAPFLSQTFTGTPGTAITSLTPTTGGTWVIQNGYTASPINALDSGGTALYSPSATGTLHNDAAPPSANYYVEAVLVWRSALTSDSVGPIGRAAAAANTFYQARYLQGSGFQLLKLVNGTATILQTVAGSFTSGNKTIRLTMVGTTISVSVDGAQIISLTDTDITGPGFAGLRFAAAQANNQGSHMVSIEAGPA